jgi:hypothetical protein
MALDKTISGPDAETYRDAAELAIYAINNGLSIGTDVPAQEAALRRSALFLDSSWTWDNDVTDADQSRAFPRNGETTIHKSIGDAQSELAVRVLAGDDIFAIAAGRQIKSETVKVDGAISEAFEYEGGVHGGGAARAFPIVDALVRRWATGLASASGGSSAGSIGINK